MPRTAFVSLLLFALAVAVLGNEFSHKNVVHLRSSDFEEKTGDGSVYFIKFYAPWCGHCKRLAPTWKSLSDEFTGDDKVVIAHVDCTTDKEVCSKAEVRGYPTLKVFHGGNEYKAYKGPRDLAALTKFVQDARKDLLEETQE